MQACKKKDYVGVYDATANVTTARQWAGTHYGYAKDSVDDSTFLATAFSRNIADTVITIEKYNALTIKTFGLLLRHKGTDSATGTVRFDTTLPSSAPTVLIYNFNTNKITFEYHNIGAWNAASGHNYEQHFNLHTK
jgi:hypothetical protein